jgi:predicted Rossmann fold flavoprotein
MFTDSGITGPTVLSMSRFYIDRAFKSRPVFPDPSSVYGLKSYIDFSGRMYADMNADRAFSIDLDLKPGLNTDELDRRVLSDFSKYNAKMLKNALSDLLPVSAIEPVIKRSGIDRFKQVSMISKQERASLVNTIKHFRLTPLSPDDPDHGVVTQGGVSLREIDPSTMSSKLCPGLFFAGEIIDADGLTGGYNLTIAFSTGRQAGNGIVNACSDT